MSDRSPSSAQRSASLVWSTGRGGDSALTRKRSIESNTDRTSFPKQRLSLLSVVCVAHAYHEQWQKTDAEGQSGSRYSARSDYLIRAKINAGCECGHVFITRRPTGDPCTRCDAGKHDLTRAKSRASTGVNFRR